MRLIQLMKKKSEKTAVFLGSLLLLTLSALSSPLHTSTLGVMTLDSNDVTAGSDLATYILLDGYYTMSITDAIAGRDFVINAKLGSTSMPGTGSAYFEVRAKPDTTLTSPTDGSNPVNNTSWQTLSGTDVIVYELDAMAQTSYSLNVEVRLVNASLADFAENNYTAEIIFTYVETWT